MDFDKARHFLNNNKRVGRLAWGGCIFLELPESKDEAPILRMGVEDSDKLYPYLVCKVDLLANDWVVIR